MTDDTPGIIVGCPCHQEDSADCESDGKRLVFAESFTEKRDGKCVRKECAAVVHCRDVRGGGERHGEKPGTRCDGESDGEGADDE